MRLRTAIRCFDMQLQADGKSDHTRRAYVRDLGKLRAWLHTDPGAAAIDPGTLAGYLSAQVSPTRPVISANRTRTSCTALK
jgi:site-specific recombinase XerD